MDTYVCSVRLREFFHNGCTPLSVIKAMLDVQDKFKGMDIFFGGVSDSEVFIYEHNYGPGSSGKYEKEKAEYLRLKEKFKDDEKTWN